MGDQVRPWEERAKCLVEAWSREHGSPSMELMSRETERSFVRHFKNSLITQASAVPSENALSSS